MQRCGADAWTAQLAKKFDGSLQPCDCVVPRRGPERTVVSFRRRGEEEEVDATDGDGGSEGVGGCQWVCETLFLRVAELKNAGGHPFRHCWMANEEANGKS